MKVSTVNYVRLLALFSLAMVAFISCLHFFMASSHMAAAPFTDMQIFATAALNFLYTGTLYNATLPLEETYRPIAGIFKFPPIYVLDYFIWLKKTAVLPKQFFNFYFWLHIVRYGLTIFLLIRYFGPHRDRAWWAVVISISFMFGPFYESLYGLTFENLLLFILVASFVLLQYGHKWPAAFLLGYSFLAKIYPLPLMLYFIFKKQWKMLIAIGVSCVGWLVIALYVIGIEPHIFYVTKIFPILMQEEIFIREKNMSIIPMFIAAGVPKEIYYIILLTITALISHRFNRNKSLSPDDDILYFCFFIPLVLLLVPNSWGNYQILLLLPILALIGSAWKIADRKRILKITIAVIAGIPMLMTKNYSILELPYYSWFNKDIITLMLSWRHYSALILWSGLATVLSINSGVKIK